MRSGTLRWWTPHRRRRFSSLLRRSAGRAGSYHRHGPDSSYYMADIEVFIDGVCAKSLSANAYFACRQSARPPPSAAYLEQIVGGACYWNLPPDYLAKPGSTVRARRVEA
jgi:hypothetical protein